MFGVQGTLIYARDLWPCLRNFPLDAPDLEPVLAPPLDVIACEPYCFVELPVHAEFPQVARTLLFDRTHKVDCVAAAHTATCDLRLLVPREAHVRREMRHGALRDGVVDRVILDRDGLRLEDAQIKAQPLEFGTPLVHARGGKHLFVAVAIVHRDLP